MIISNVLCGQHVVTTEYTERKFVYECNLWWIFLKIRRLLKSLKNYHPGAISIPCPVKCGQGIFHPDCYTGDFYSDYILDLANSDAPVSVSCRQTAVCHVMCACASVVVNLRDNYVCVSYTVMHCARSTYYVVINYNTLTRPARRRRR